MSSRDEMSLPDGFTCDDCYAYHFCLGIGCTNPGSTRCDWFPVRFVLSEACQRELADRRKAHPTVIPPPVYPAGSGRAARWPSEPYNGNFNIPFIKQG